MPDKPITVAVIADTHVASLNELPDKVLETLKNVDVIIHLGDFTSPKMLEELKKFSNFYGIYGNHDRLPEMRTLKKMDVLEIAGKRLGIIHGLFYPVGRQRRMKAWFKKDNIDILLFGHSHVITSKVIDGIPVFNPGTLTGQFPATFNSYGLLTLNGTIDCEIIRWNKHTPIRRQLLTFIPALIIRNGTVFLESWPYIDISPFMRGLRFTLKKVKQARNKMIPRQRTG